MSDKQGQASKLFVAAIAVVAIALTSIWMAVYYFEAPGYDPEVAQEYVQHFNRRCIRDLQDVQACRDLVGFHHRACFEAHLTRKIPEDPTSAYVYDRSLYLACMWEKHEPESPGEEDLAHEPVANEPAP